MGSVIHLKGRGGLLMEELLHLSLGEGGIPSHLYCIVSVYFSRFFREGWGGEAYFCG